MYACVHPCVCVHVYMYVSVHVCTYMYVSLIYVTNTYGSMCSYVCIILFYGHVVHFMYKGSVLYIDKA